MHHPLPSPAAIPAAAPSRVCAIHGVAKVLRSGGPGRSPLWRCRECGRAAEKRFYHRRFNRRSSRQLVRALRAEAGELRLCLGALVKVWGGWEKLLSGFPAEERARLALKLAEGERELMARAQEEERKAQRAVKDASKDVGVVAAAAEILRAAGWTIAPPE